MTDDFQTWMHANESVLSGLITEYYATKWKYEADKKRELITNIAMTRFDSITGIDEHVTKLRATHSKLKGVLNKAKRKGIRETIKTLIKKREEIKGPAEAR